MIAMVSNMSDSSSYSSTAGAAAHRRRKVQLECRGWAVVLILSIALAYGSSAAAETVPAAEADRAQPNDHPIGDALKFLAGGAFGLALHESGHLIFDVAFDADP